jgi:peptidoglycan/LPS O-acetylase OafA/YrhL
MISLHAKHMPNGLSTAPGDSPPAPARIEAVREKDIAIETIRGLAIILMVASHVIGDLPDTGMRVANDSIYRYLYKSTVYVRMPLFIAIAGFVYALRPIAVGGAAEFLRKKVRVILVPFVTAATIQYALRASVPGINRPMEWHEIWRVYVFPFDQFWFSQVMFSIFLVATVAERMHLLSDVRRWSLALAVTVVLAFFPPSISFFSLNLLPMMLPMFVLGCGFCRFAPKLSGASVAAAAVAVFSASLAVQQLTWFGLIAPGGMAQLGAAVLEGLSFSALLIRFRRPVPWLATLGAYSYTIYLYHVFGTAGVRMLLHRMGVDHEAVHFAFGLAGGLMFPVAVERVAPWSWAAADPRRRARRYRGASDFEVPPRD